MSTMILLRLPSAEEITATLNIEAETFLDAFAECATGPFQARVTKETDGYVDLAGWKIAPTDWHKITD